MLLVNVFSAFCSPLPCTGARFAPILNQVYRLQLFFITGTEFMSLMHYLHLRISFFLADRVGITSRIGLVQVSRMPCPCRYYVRSNACEDQAAAGCCTSASETFNDFCSWWSNVGNRLLQSGTWRPFSLFLF